MFFSSTPDASELSSAYYQQQAQQFLNNNHLSNLESSLIQQNGNCNYDLINNQTYSHQLARACPLTIQQRSTNLQTNPLNGHSLDALNTVGLSTATKDVFKKPIQQTNTLNSSTMNGLANGSIIAHPTMNTMSFTRHLLINSSGQTGSTGQLNSLSKCIPNALTTNGHTNEPTNSITSNLTNGLNGFSSEVDVRRLCLSEQQQLEFNLAQELEQKSKLSQQNQINTEIVHSTPKQSYGTLKRNSNKQTKAENAGTLTRTPESKVRNICAKLFGSGNSRTTNQQSTTNQSNNQIKLNGQLTNDQLNGHSSNSQLSNGHLSNGQLNKLVNGQPKSSSKLLASAVTQQTNKKSDLTQSTSQQSNDDLSSSNVIYAEIRKKQVNNCEKLNQLTDFGHSKSGCMNNTSNCNLPPSNQSNCNNTSIIDDKYVVVVDSSCVSANSEHSTSNQSSLTVKNSPIKSVQSANTSSNTTTTGILTTDLDQCNQKTTTTNNGQQQSDEHLKTELNQQMNHLSNNTQAKNLQTKQDKCVDDKIGLESPTTSSSESGRGTLNGEQQINQNLRQTSESHSMNFDQTSVTSDEMKRLKTFKEEVLENWNQNKKLIVSSCLVNEPNSLNSSSNSKLAKGDKADGGLNTFEQVQLKIQKLLNDDDAFTNDEDFDDLLASEAYQSYTAQAMNHCTLNSDGKLDRLSVVNEFTNESDGSWLSDSTHANSTKKQLNNAKSMSAKQSGQSNQQLNQSANLNSSQSSNQHNHSTNHQSNPPPANKHQQHLKTTTEQAKQFEATDHLSQLNQPCVNSLNRNTSSLITPSQQQQLPQSSTTTVPGKLETPTQSPRLHHLHVHQSPKTALKAKNGTKLNARPIGKLNVNQQQTKSDQTADFASLLSENSRRLTKLNNSKNQYKNRSMDDLTDLMDDLQDLNSVYTEATTTMNYAAPTVVKKQLKGIESMYSEVG